MMLHIFYVQIHSVYSFYIITTFVYNLAECFRRLYFILTSVDAWTDIITGFTSQDTVSILMHQPELPNRKIGNETKKKILCGDLR